MVYKKLKCLPLLKQERAGFLENHMDSEILIVTIKSDLHSIVRKWEMLETAVSVMEL